MSRAGTSFRLDAAELARLDALVTANGATTRARLAKTFFLDGMAREEAKQGDGVVSAKGGVRKAAKR